MDSVVAKFYITGNGDISRFTNFVSLITGKYGSSNGINKTSSYKAPMVPVPHNIKTSKRKFKCL